MKLLFLILSSFALLTSALAAPPNIVLINADDLGWKDTGYAGSDFYETPHLDALAASSMNFTQAYPLTFKKLIVDLSEKTLHLTHYAPVPCVEIYVEDAGINVHLRNGRLLTAG